MRHEAYSMNQFLSSKRQPNHYQHFDFISLFYVDVAFCDQCPMASWQPSYAEEQKSRNLATMLFNNKQPRNYY